jgi:hypothetical protein
MVRPRQRILMREFINSRFAISFPSIYFFHILTNNKVLMWSPTYYVPIFQALAILLTSLVLIIYCIYRYMDTILNASITQRICLTL